MIIKKLIYKMIPPCKKCPYKLGLVQTFVNPCPDCRDNGYSTYEKLVRPKPENDEPEYADIH